LVLTKFIRSRRFGRIAWPFNQCRTKFATEVPAVNFRFIVNHLNKLPISFEAEAIRFLRLHNEIFVARA
jgi:hypothetical protein